MNRSFLALLAALALAGSAIAQVPRTISYQGILTDNLGSPVPDGVYSLTVRLYDAAAAGSLLYTETQPSVSISKGGYNVLIGSVTPLSLPFDKPLWLSLQVGSDPELTPRVALGSSPYALGLSLPFEGTLNGLGATVTVRNSIGPALVADGSIRVTSPGVSTQIVSLGRFGSEGGQVAAKDENGTYAARMEIDANGTGGYFAVYRNTTTMGFSVNGNDGTEEPIVTVSGSVRSAVLDMSVSGDAAVSLPSSSISSSEESNEPGVAQYYANSTIQIGTGITTIASRTISAPDDGYVIAIAGGSIELGHLNGADSRIIYGINDQAGAFAASTGVTGVPSGAPSGNYRMPTPWVGVWPVAAGSQTFYLLAQRVGAANGAVWNDPTITLLYVSTAYGTVSGNLASEGTADRGASGPPPQAELERERTESIAFDRARMQRELDTIRRQVDALKQRLAEDPNAGTTAAK